MLKTIRVLFRYKITEYAVSGESSRAFCYNKAVIITKYVIGYSWA